MPLQDYKDIIGTTASIVTLAQFFSGVFVCRDIVKKGNTTNIPALPFIGGISLSLLFLKYAVIINDMNMIPLNTFGAALNIGYLACYFLYTAEKKSVVEQVIKCGIFTGLLLVYPYFEDPSVLEFRFGIITTVLMFMLIASPFAQLGEVMRTGSTESLPFPMILSGTVVSFMWLLYGIAIENGFIQIQNTVGFVMSVTQLSLFAIYPSKPSKEKKKIS